MGGYKGDSVARYLKASHHDVWVVEPIPEFFYQLKSRFEGNERVHLCHYALGKENTTVRLHYSGDATSSFLQAENSVYVPAVTWETFLGLNKLSEKQINFVEMNIEGAEFELLESIISSGAILLVSTLVVQFHKVEELSPYKKELLRNSLRKSHNSVMNFEWVWEVWQIKV